MRQAISPRLAIRIFLNLRGLKAIRTVATKRHKKHKISCAFCARYSLTFNAEEGLAVLDRLPVLHINLHYFTTRLSLNLVHEFHGLDDTNNTVGFDVATDLHKRLGSWRSRTVERTHNW